MVKSAPDNVAPVKSTALKVPPLTEALVRFTPAIQLSLQSALLAVTLEKLALWRLVFPRNAPEGKVLFEKSTPELFAPPPKR